MWTIFGKKVISAALQRSNADNLITEERYIGIEIVKTLKIFYEITDNKVYYSNFFTRFLNRIREFSFSFYTIRSLVQDGAKRFFRGYSETKFLEAFGGAFNEANGYNHSHPDSDGSFEHPSFFRILARKESIQKLFIQECGHEITKNQCKIKNHIQELRGLIFLSKAKPQ